MDNEDNEFERSEGESTSTESSVNDERRRREADDREFGEFDYTKEDDDDSETSVHQIMDDKQEEKDIASFYDDKKEDTIYTRKNPYTSYAEWSNWDLLHPVPIKHSFWMLHPNIILWAMRTWIIAGHKVAIPYRLLGYMNSERSGDGQTTTK